MSLTTCQSNALEEFKKFLMDRNKKEFLLSGMGGAGKSYLIPKFIEFTETLDEINKLLNVQNPYTVEDIKFMSPTHKAANVLQKFINAANLSEYSVSTIHSGLGLRRGINEDTGESFFYRPKNSKVSLYPNTLFFIEESSMIGEELHKIFLKHLPNNSKIVWLGDFLQLPPVNEKASPVFNNAANITKAELITPVRFNNPELIDINMKMRDSVLTGTKPSLSFNSKIRPVDKQEFIKQASIDFINGSDIEEETSKIICWTNNKVKFYNDTIRDIVYKNMNQTATTIPKFFVGERIIIQSSVNTVMNQGKLPSVLPSQMSLRIEAVELKSVDIADTLVEFYYLVTPHGTIRVPVNKAEATRAIKPLKDKKQWKQWYAYSDTFASVNRYYAITAHQAQGSTYRKVYIDLPDMLNNKRMSEMLRLLYVAFSRASEEIIILKG